MTTRVVDHPLARHLLGELRERETPPAAFRPLARKLATILMLEATRDLPESHRRVTTPLEETDAQSLAPPVVVVPVLRAGLGMTEAIVDLFPEVRVGYIGLERDETTFEARQYYSKLPRVKGAATFVVDPMLATGGSASAAIAAVKEAGSTWVRMICVVAAPEGIRRLEQDHPEVDVVTTAVDRELNEDAYILPGLGDFGDRLFGTDS